jgi:hypothetical protein
MMHSLEVTTDRFLSVANYTKKIMQKQSYQGF